jgi:hypothetical protein
MKDKAFWKIIVVCAIILAALWMYGHRWTYSLAPGLGLVKIHRLTGAMYHYDDGQWVRR